jgi:hypothetical protein
VAGSQADGTAVNPLIEQVVMHGAGAVYVWVKVQVTSAENTAVTLQLAPLELKPVNAYAAGLVNGAFSTTGVPPQELLMVNVPVAGAFKKVAFPLTSYCCVALLQAVGVAVTDVIAQVTGQGAGAV